jgi:hypothetical protein
MDPTNRPRRGSAVHEKPCSSCHNAKIAIIAFQGGAIDARGTAFIFKEFWQCLFRPITGPEEGCAAGALLDAPTVVLSSE